MRVWIDIENPPQVQYLAPFKARFEALGADVVVTSVENAITEQLLAQRGIQPVMAGSKSRAGVLHKGLHALEAVEFVDAQAVRGHERRGDLGLVPDRLLPRRRCGLRAPR